MLPAALLGFAAALATAWLLLRAGFALPQANGRAQSVDGLRGLLAVAVAIHHMVIWFAVVSLGRGWQAPDLPVLNQFGAGSVALFLMITGWLCWGRLAKGMAARDWVQLYIGRAFRILPMVLFAIALVLALAWAKSGVAFRSDQWGSLALWLFGLDLRPLGGVGDAARINASVFWYLGQEWFFYAVILPLLALALALWKRVAPAALLLALVLPVAWAVSIALPLYGEDYLVWKSPWAFRLFLPVILSGMAVAALLKVERLKPFIAHRLTGWAALALFLGTISFSQFPYGWALPGMVPFFLCVASGRHYNAVLSARPVVLLGNLSFSIYVLHPELLYALFAFPTPLRAAMAGWPAEITVPAVMVLVVLLAALVHVLVEKPSAALGARVKAALSGNGKPVVMQVA